MEFATVNLNFKTCGFMVEDDRFMLALATAIKEADYVSPTGGSGTFAFKGKTIRYTAWFKNPVTEKPALTIQNDTYSLGDTIDWNGLMGYFLFLGFARVEIQEEFADNGKL